jgi:hypothetical protein
MTSIFQPSISAPTATQMPEGLAGEAIKALDDPDPRRIPFSIKVSTAIIGMGGSAG